MANFDEVHRGVARYESNWGMTVSDVEDGSFTVHTPTKDYVVHGELDCSEAVCMGELHDPDDPHSNSWSSTTYFGTYKDAVAGVRMMVEAACAVPPQ